MNVTVKMSHNLYLTNPSQLVYICRKIHPIHVIIRRINLKENQSMQMYICNESCTAVTLGKERFPKMGIQHDSVDMVSLLKHKERILYVKLFCVQIIV